MEDEEPLRIVRVRGKVRAVLGDQRAVETRIGIDPTARNDVIAPEFAVRLGVKLNKREETAGETVGGGWQLGGLLELELALMGVQLGSGLSHELRAERKVKIGSVQDFDLVLGSRFLRDVRANFAFNEPCVIQLTGNDGTTIEITAEETK